ncbi:MAG: hypothetical protein IOC98_15655 [Rhodobacter sp.]|nr:hypothetical protein [Rhodobacter sp.]MCA3501435.1 hypothetical protein [Rhodobacter sp.]
MWVVIAVCAALGLRIFLVLSVLKSDARRWVRLSASAVIFSTAIALISLLEMIAGFGLSVRVANFRNEMTWAVIYSFMALDIIGSVVLVATSSRGLRLAKALLIAAGFLAVFVQAIGIQLESL